jgi:chromosome segregation ATPase
LKSAAATTTTTTIPVDIGKPPAAPVDVEALKREIREQVLKQANDELAIVSLGHEEEMKELEAQLDHYRQAEHDWKSTKSSLESTLEELMGNFEKAMDEYSMQRSKDTAKIGLLETDVERFRTSTSSVKAENQKLQAMYDELKAREEEFSQASTSSTERIAELEQERDELSEFISVLKERAESKLKSAHIEYTKVQKDAGTKQNRIRGLESELQTVRQNASMYMEQFNSSQAACHQLEDRVGKLDRALHDAESRANELQLNFSNSEMEVNSLHQKLRELTTTTNIYKEQLSQANEELRSLKDDASMMLQLERETKQAQADIDALQKENATLKSRIYDSLETERRLHGQLKSLAHGDSAAAASAASLSTLESQLKDKSAKLDEVNQALQAKVNENTELMNMCDVLIKEVEQLKARR